MTPVFETSEFPGSPVPYHNGTDMSVLGAVNVLLRNWRMVAGITLAVVLIVLTVVLLTPRTYSSEMSVIAESRKGTNVPGASIAAQFGITLPTTDPSHSPQFYADLVHSREILGPIVDSVYVYPAGGRQIRQNLIPVFAKGIRNPLLRHDEAVKRLGRSITSTISTKTNVITVVVKSPNAVLSHEIALKLLDQLNAFNVDEDRLKASGERKFTEQVMAESEMQLHAAEQRQEEFEQNNAQFKSPRLKMEQERIAREVLMRQQVYTSLAQAAEQAKIDEARDTPFLSTVERPNTPILPDSRGGVIKLLLALIGGALLGILSAFVRELSKASRERPSPERLEFDDLKRGLIEQVRHPLQARSESSMRRSQP